MIGMLIKVYRIWLFFTNSYVKTLLGKYKKVCEENDISAPKVAFNL